MLLYLIKKNNYHLNQIINDAKDTHSVNTIMLDEDDSLIGENTDVFGFQAAI